MPIKPDKKRKNNTTNRRSEIGSIGRSHSALFQYNLATEEYLNKLKWPDNLTIYEKMKRSDAQIKALLLVLELPIRSTQWYVEPADNSRKAKQVAEFIEENLFKGPPDGMTMHWDDLLRQICLMFPFGHSIFEKVYKVDKSGFLTWRKFSPRPVSTIYDFLYDTNGGPIGIQQYKINESFQIVDIPIDKLLMFSHRMENGDVRGTSVLRSAYKHWYIKDFIYKIHNIGIERNHVGTPYVKLPPGVTPEDEAKGKEVVTSLRSSESGGATIPDGFDLDIFEGKRQMQDIMPYLNHQDLMIVRSVLAQFVNLGSGDTGSFALSKDQSDLFLMMLNSEAKYIANVFNSYAIPQLVRYNFNSDLYPKLTFKPLGGSDKLLETLKLLVDGKLIVPDLELETWLREMLDLPEKSEEEYDIKDDKGDGKDDENKDESNDDAKVNKTSSKDNDSEDKDEMDKEIEEDAKEATSKEDKKKEDKKKMSEDVVWHRDLTPYEKKVNFADIDKKITSLEESFKNDGKKYINNIIKDLSSKAKKTKPDKLAMIQVGGKNELTQFVMRHMKESIQFGMDQAAKELDIESSKVDINSLKAEASLVANNIAERIKTKFLFEYLKNLSNNDEISIAAKKVERLLMK
jgi:hypothetical protein